MAVTAGGPCDGEPVLSALDFLTRGKQIASAAPPIVSTSAAVPLPNSENGDQHVPATTTPTTLLSPPLPDECANKSIPPVSVATTSRSANPVLPDRSMKKRYKQRVLTVCRPGGPTQPAPSVLPRPAEPEPEPASEDFEDPKGKQLSVEELQLKCKQQWQRYFPWLLISENKAGRPCMHCSVCMVFGDPNYKYGRNGDGGIDIQKQTMRKHHHSLKHEAAVLRKEERDGVKKVQKSIT
ncbi:unnamed protein product [Closterium sp. NIES-53]